VGITGTSYRPLDNMFQIKEALENLVGRINETENPLEKALTAVLMISYIQPFEDGNKRTARILGNALLVAHEYCPLSYRSIDELEYKKGMILFYEQNNAFYFKQLFIEQFRQAIEKYF
jgi:Fic family protein